MNTRQGLCIVGIGAYSITLIYTLATLYETRQLDKKSLIMLPAAFFCGAAANLGKHIQANAAQENTTPATTTLLQQADEKLESSNPILTAIAEVALGAYASYLAAYPDYYQTSLLPGSGDLGLILLNHTIIIITAITLCLLKQTYDSCYLTQTDTLPQPHK